MSEPLAAVSDYDGLLSAIRARVAELNITHANLDDVSGIQSGYASKLLANPPMKTLGMMSLGSVLGALGIKLLVVEDAEALKRVAPMHEKRKIARPKPDGKHDGKHEQNILRVTASFLATIASYGGRKRAEILTPARRRKIAREAARARWDKLSAVAIVPHGYGCSCGKPGTP